MLHLLKNYFLEFSLTKSKTVQNLNSQQSDKVRSIIDTAYGDQKSQKKLVQVVYFVNIINHADSFVFHLHLSQDYFGPVMMEWWCLQ